MLSTDLQWGSLPLFVVGALAGLQIGPGALNLMGARHGADIVATKLGVNEDPDEGKVGGVFTNVFAALAGDSDDTSEEDSSNSSDDDDESTKQARARAALATKARLEKEKAGRKTKKSNKNGRGGRRHRRP